MIFVTRMDNRNRLYPTMLYQITFTNILKYYTVKSWCTETWGFAVDYEFMFTIPAPINKGIWSSRTPTRREEDAKIYLRGDEELSLFTLKWL